MKVDLSSIATEMQNVNTMNIDELSTLEMVRLINAEDRIVVEAVHNTLDSVAQGIDIISDAILNGGRLVYIGAGTSGRLGVLDASEVLPTFGVGEEAVIGIIAGGDVALRMPLEASEDSEDFAVEDLKNINFGSKDVLCAIASSGRTPYCIGGLKYAKGIGAKTISLACVENSEIGRIADVVIEASVGQEVVTGSTRMKSGTATKMILNMLSTGSMIKLGKVYGNLMVDVKTSNLKLIERAKNIIMKATGVDYLEAESLLESSENHVKTAIVMHKLQIDFETAKKYLEDFNGHISKTIKYYEK